MTNGGDTGTWGRTSKQHIDINTVDINNNQRETLGRTDYIQGDITGNTWETNQLMMGNRKDHIRVRKQRQRETNCDSMSIKIILI